MESDKAKPPTVLTFALVTNNVDLFDLLVSQGASVNEVDKDGHSLVHWAVACGRHSILMRLLERGANVSLRDHSGAHALHYATQLAHIDQSTLMVQSLLSHIGGPDKMDSEQQTPLFWASLCSGDRLDRLPIAKILMEHGASVTVRNVHGMTVLHSAAGSGNCDFIQMVLDGNCPVPVDSPDRSGFTPLFYAATCGSIDCMRLLLDHGASVNHRSSRLKTVAHYCALRGDVDALKLLLSWGARLDLADEFGLTVLHEAVQSRNLACVKWLLRCLNEVNAFDCFGRTALHVAVAMGDTAVAAALLEYGADIHAVVQNKGRFMAVAAIAARRNDKATSELLARYAGSASMKSSNSRGHESEKKRKSNIPGQRKEQRTAVPSAEERKQRFCDHSVLERLRSTTSMETSQIEWAQKRTAPLPPSTSRPIVTDRCASTPTREDTAEVSNSYHQRTLSGKTGRMSKKTSAGLSDKPLDDSSLFPEPRTTVPLKALKESSKKLNVKPMVSFAPLSRLNSLSSPLSMSVNQQVPDAGTRRTSSNKLNAENQHAQASCSDVASAKSADAVGTSAKGEKAGSFQNTTWKTQWVFSQLPLIHGSNKVLPYFQLASAEKANIRVPGALASPTIGRSSGGRSPLLGTRDIGLRPSAKRSRSLRPKGSVRFFLPLNDRGTSPKVDAKAAEESFKPSQPQHALSDIQKPSGDLDRSPLPSSIHVVEPNSRAPTRSLSSEALNDDARSYLCLNKLLRYMDDLQVGISPSQSFKFPNVRLPPFLRNCSKLLDGSSPRRRSTSVLESALLLQRLERSILSELLNIKHIEQAYRSIEEEKLVQRCVRHFLDSVNVPTLDRLARGERFRKFQDWIAFLKGILRRLHEADARLFGELERDRNAQRSKSLISGGKKLLSSSHSGLSSGID